MTTEQEGKILKIIWETSHTRQTSIVDDEEDSDPDLDMVSVLPSLWFY